MDMSSSSNSSTAAASAPHNHQQEVMVSSPIIKEEAQSPKQPQDTQQASGSEEHKPRPQLPEVLKCPRCNSNNTKFCYYNNYSTTQPRYFCKACRRYWTHGGTLRNVPVGGGRRKNKCASGSVSGSGTSSSSSAAYVPLSPGINTSSSKMSTNTQLMMPNMTMPTPTTTSLFPNVLPTLMSTGGGGDFNFTMDNQHASLPFTPMSLSNQASVPVLDVEGTETMPSFLEMLRRGLLHDSSSYNAGLVMSGGNNKMDMSFPQPSYGAMYEYRLSGTTTDDASQLVGTQHGVNTDGGFVGSTRVHEEKEGDDNAIVKSSKNNNGGSLLDRYWTKPNNNNNNIK